VIDESYLNFPKTGKQFILCVPMGQVGDASSHKIYLKIHIPDGHTPFGFFVIPNPCIDSRTPTMRISLCFGPEVVALYGDSDPYRGIGSR